MRPSNGWSKLAFVLGLFATACASDGSGAKPQDCCVTPRDGDNPVDGPSVTADSTLDGTIDVALAGDGAIDAVPAEGGTEDTSGELCRNYASEYTDGDGKTTSCSFDAGAVRLTCDKEGSRTFYDYPSRRLFIEEAHSVGRTTYTKRSVSISATAFVYSYDAQDRLTGFDHITQTTFYQHYDAWDAAGRPTSGVGSYDDTCTGWSVGFSYDDVARTALQQYSNISVCPTNSYTFYHLRSFYDVDGNLTKRELINMAGDLVRTESFTIAQTTRICL